jgi:hypothetical protein
MTVMMRKCFRKLIWWMSFSVPILAYFIASQDSLYNICFAEWDMHHLQFDCCKQLQYLYLHNCDAGGLLPSEDTCTRLKT